MNQSHTFFVLLLYPIFYKSSLCPPHRYLGYKDCALKCTHSELNTLFNVTHCNVHGPDTQTLMFLLHIVKYWAEYLHPLTSWSSLGCSLKNSIKRGKKIKIIPAWTWKLPASVTATGWHYGIQYPFLLITRWDAVTNNPRYDFIYLRFTIPFDKRISFFSSKDSFNHFKWKINYFAIGKNLENIENSYYCFSLSKKIL